MARIFFTIVSALLLSPLPGDSWSSENRLNILTSFPPDFYLPFKQLFSQQYPQIEINIRNKKTTAGLTFLQRQSDHNIDIFWASAPDAFEILDKSKLLAEIIDVDFPFPSEIHGYPLKHSSNHYLGFALSGYGIVFNRAYCERYKLPYPASWSDLTNPLYFSHLALSSPSRSGTTHLMIEMILQHYGWDKGWQTILQMAGNAATITARSYGVPEGVKQGQFGLGLTIDFLSRRINLDNIEFVYASETRILPASVALLKHSANPQNARSFIRFLLSRKGQELLQTKAISRLPIDPELYAGKNNPLNPYSLEPENSAKTFDAKLSRKRYQLINSLFDHFITFQLTSLQRIWQKINHIQQLLDKNLLHKNDWQQEISEIRHTMSTIPLDESQSNQQQYLRFANAQNKNYSSSGYLSSALSPFKNMWLNSLIESENRLERISRLIAKDS